MNTIANVLDTQLIETLRRGGVAVIRTDTLYGIVARADDQDAVQRVYNLKSRDDTKSPIVLISNSSEVYDKIDQPTANLLNSVWPGKVSVIIPSILAPSWIKRDNDSVAYRLPDSHELQKLIEQTGPLIAPSANPEGEQPALTVQQAYDYFGDNVDLYVDQGRIDDEHPSQLLKLHDNGEIERLR